MIPTPFRRMMCVLGLVQCIVALLVGYAVVEGSPLGAQIGLALFMGTRHTPQDFQAFTQALSHQLALSEASIAPHGTANPLRTSLSHLDASAAPEDQMKAALEVLRPTKKNEPPLRMLILVAHEDARTPFNQALQRLLTAGYAFNQLATSFRVVYIANGPEPLDSSATSTLPPLHWLPWPVQVVFGELDGVRRLLHYAILAHHTTRRQDASNVGWTPIDGANHQLLSQRHPWAAWDLPADRPFSDVVQDVARYVALFASEDVQPAMQATQRRAVRLFEPVWDALMLESNYNLYPPCHVYNDRNVSEPNGRRGLHCFVGSPWTELVQRRMMVGQAVLRRWRPTDVRVRDELHYAWTVRPIHHPYVAKESSCLVEVETVSQNVYDTRILHAEPNPFLPEGLTTADDETKAYVEWPLSAMEVKAKMKSKQSFEQAANNQSVRFEDTDGGRRRCAELNQLAWQWVLRRVGLSEDDLGEEYFWDAVSQRLKSIRPESSLQDPDDEDPWQAFRKRFQTGRIPNMTMLDDDGPLFNVFGWIFKDLEQQYDPALNAITIRAPESRFSTSFPLAFSSGMHYCKLLSPLRALEWLVTDGLRQHHPTTLQPVLALQL